LNKTHLIQQVDTERIYRHILRIEGAGNPIDNPQKLDDVSDYIHSEFANYGLRVNEQEFKVEGFDATFANVEGVVGEEESSELLIVSHYDTVRDSPGANDNGSGVAVMLEGARILSQEANVHNLRFISFTLEEANPKLELKTRNIAQNLGLTEERSRYATERTHRLMKQLIGLRAKALASGKNPKEALAEARCSLDDQLDKTEIEYLKELEEMYKGITLTSWPGETALMGSGFWVEEAVRTNKEVLGVLNLETIGYTSDRKNSQVLPEGMDPTMFQTHRVSDFAVGNFIAVIGDRNSEKLAESFCSQCKVDPVDVPYACLEIPLSFEDIAQFGLFDLLRSDHAPFWRARIPALMVTDTANFRYPFYHTQADTIDKLHFEFMTKVCKASIATAFEICTC